MAETQQNNEVNVKIGIIKKLWQLRKHLLLEPLLVCAILPLGMLSVTNLNFNLDKACRVNLGYDTAICESMLEKQLNNINCNGIEFGNTPDALQAYKTNEDGVLILDLNYTVCKAEMESQKEVTNINAIREPIASIFPIIVILFAGGWSDRSGLRKPCMVFPVIGEIISLSAHIISSIWMNTIPMEVCAVIEKVVPSMFGGQTLLTIGVLSYITETTTEENRAFRFGVFTVIVNITLLIGISLSGVMYNLLGYLNIYILASTIFLAAVAYLLFFIPEIKSKQAAESYPYNVSDEWFDMPMETTKSFYSLEPNKKKRNIFVDFFDPTSAYDCFEVVFRKREFNGRLLLILFVILSLLISAPNDKDYVYMFTMKNLMWNGDMYSMYLTFSMMINLAGTVIMTLLFIKVFKMSNAFAGFCASFLSIISNLATAFSTTTAAFYIAQVINMFAFCKEIMINAIISSCITKEEIGRVYSVQGIIKAVCGFLLPLLYARIYSTTMEKAPGSIFLFSEVFIVPATILFLVIYALIKRQNRLIKKSKNESEQTSVCEADPDIEVTRF